MSESSGAGRARVRAVLWKRPLDEQVRAALGETPAYLRRARRVERETRILLAEAARRYEEMLRFVLLGRHRLAERPSARARTQLERAVARFNARWRRWVHEEAPLDAVNREIRGYNRWYRIERECALRHVPPSALSFEPKEEITPADLLARFPPVPA